MSDRPKQILLVEDHPDTRLVLTTMLKRNGFEVIAADSVATAMSAFDSNTFDLLISDIALPDGSGWEIARAHRSTPSIAISGYGTEEVIAESERAGFAIHLIKPVPFPRLLESITAVLGNSVDGSAT